jgi:hypothetical protein
MKNSMKVFTVKIPEYNLAQSLNFTVIGAKLDNIIKENLPGKWLAVRGVSLQDHPGRSLAWLVEKIQELGTDRYDPQRKGVHDDLDKEFAIDLHAVSIMYKDEMVCPHYSGERCETGSAIGELLSDCHGGAVVDRGYALRIDVIMIYDLDQLKSAPLTWTDKGPTHTDSPISPQETCTFQFKNPANKKGALLGIIKIER